MEKSATDSNETLIEQFNENMGKSMGRFLGFCTVLLILTLNASNGKDLLDVTVPLIEAYTQSLIKQ